MAFRAVVGKYRALLEEQCLQPRPIDMGAKGRCMYERVHEDFMADVWLAAKRVLSPEDFRAFRLHHLEGRKALECCRALGLDRNSFWTAIRRIEATAGRTFLTLRPYPLYPLGSYFSPPSRSNRAQVGQPSIPLAPPKPKPGNILRPVRLLHLPPPPTPLQHIMALKAKQFSFSQIATRLNQWGIPAPEGGAWNAQRAMREVAVNEPRRGRKLAA